LKARIVCWDIEATNLNADFGIILCCGFKEIGKKAEVFSILDYNSGGDLIRAEKLLLRDMHKELMKADVWVCHFGCYYDIPFVNSRLLYHRLPLVPPNHPLVDTWKISRKKLKLRNNRLNTISEFLKTDEHKNPIKPEQWTRALGGHKKSMQYIVEHCRRDVVVLDEVYQLLKPLETSHPNVSLMNGKRDGCRNCGSQDMQLRGFSYTKAYRYRRYQCVTCGAWGRYGKNIPL
jgi:uncharacterized protein YprB with RNaseH-like and TPR domain